MSLDNLNIKVSTFADHKSGCQILKKALLQLGPELADEAILQGEELFNRIHVPFNFFAKELVSESIDQTNNNISWLLRRLFSGIATPPEAINDSKYTLLLSIIKLYCNSKSLEDFELRFRKAKAAWSTKKNRDANNGKKACNFQLAEDLVDCLDELAKSNRRKKNEMLEILIEDAWLEMKGKKPARR